MFGQAKTLIVVYKDEMLLNQLKKLIESNDDANDGTVFGTTDDSINIVSWTEKVWLNNKKAGNIKDKVLFLGEIKGTDKLTPVVDIKFDKHGVKFGWAGNQAVLFVDPKVINTTTDYEAFVEELTQLPVPEIIKNGNKARSTTNSDEGQQDAEPIADEKPTGEGETPEIEETKEGKFVFFKKAKAAIETGADNVGNALKKVGGNAAEFATDLFRDKAMVRRQMLFYGVVKLYEDGLESFMKM